MTLRDLIQELVDRYGSQLAASNASGIDRTRLRLVLQDAEDKETLELTNCLKLARALARSPSEVLRIARKAEEATLIEELYGPENTIILTAEERKFIEAMRFEGRTDSLDAFRRYVVTIQAVSNAMLASFEERLKTAQNREHRNSILRRSQFLAQQYNESIRELKILLNAVLRAKGRRSPLWGEEPEEHRMDLSLDAGLQALARSRASHWHVESRLVPLFDEYVKIADDSEKAARMVAEARSDLENDRNTIIVRVDHELAQNGVDWTAEKKFIRDSYYKTLEGLPKAVATALGKRLFAPFEDDEPEDTFPGTPKVSAKKSARQSPSRGAAAKRKANRRN